MRELKFRVWSNYWKKFATEAELYIDGSVDAIFEDDDGVPHHENTDVVVEQYTGLKDKNGKEIYEGDILRTPSGLHIEIGWNNTHARFGYYSVAEDYNMVTSLGKCEVIGNRHENKELLEEE